MFNLFGGKRTNQIAVTDKVWITETNKWNSCAEQVKNESNTILAVWFEESFDKLEKIFSAWQLPVDKIFRVRELARNYLQNNSLIFAEHYPMHSKEQELYEKLGLFRVVVYSSLDEVLFTHFGGNRIIDLVKQMGMKEEEALQHPAITSAINKAQEKIEARLTVEQSARSAAEWFRINLPQL